MDDSAKRVGSAVITVICLIIWFALRAERCNQESSYDYSYTPSYPIYTPPTDYSGALDRTQKVLDELMANDAAWAPAITEIDPIAIAANAKNTQCQALDEVVEQSPTWKIDVSDTVLVDGQLETTVMSPFPLYVTHAEDGLPKMSPETIARSHLLVAKIVEGSDVSAPRLTTKDLLIEIAPMPKPTKGMKKVKGAPAPGKPIARGWIYDHLQKRVVCAGFIALPNAKTGEEATLLDDEQLAKLVDVMPQALKTTPPPKVEAE
jgi:hypothetical protein